MRGGLFAGGGMACPVWRETAGKVAASAARRYGQACPRRHGTVLPGLAAVNGPGFGWRDVTVFKLWSAGATWTLAGGGESSVAYTRALKDSVHGRDSIPPGFGGGEANIHLQEDILWVASGRTF